MNWEEITSPDFSAARESCSGVCLLPMGVLEKHGTHLPLGTDGLSAHELCVRAATRESAMVFPEYYFGSIAEARQHPGTVALPFALILDLLEAVCDEISRNGFKKIILVNAHGGNTSLLDALSLTMLKKQKDYMVYYRRIAFLMDHPMMESRQEWHGHADEGETSIMMELFPELVRDSGVPGAFGFHHHQLQRLEELGVNTPVTWTAGFPGHLCGDTTPGSPEKGKVLLEQTLDNLVALIRWVKTHDDAERIYREFHAAAQNPQPGFGEDA